MHRIKRFNVHCTAEREGAHVCKHRSTMFANNVAPAPSGSTIPTRTCTKYSGQSLYNCGVLYVKTCVDDKPKLVNIIDIILKISI